MINTLEKIAMVQCYIHHMKGVDVDIEVPRTINHMMLLDQAFIVARNYINR